MTEIVKRLEIYRKYHVAYKAAYPATAETMHRLAELD